MRRFKSPYYVINPIQKNGDLLGLPHRAFSHSGRVK
jgi:hypothetical protein